MQIMPATAAGIARQLGVEDFSVDQLYDPAINTRFSVAIICAICSIAIPKKMLFWRPITAARVWPTAMLLRARRRFPKKRPI